MRPSARSPWPALLLTCTALLGGCASLPGAVPVDVEGRRVEALVARHPGPTVVFENGLGGTLDAWAKVWPEIAKDTAAVAYNRAGYGRSDPARTPRDGESVVAELRAMLTAQQLAPPYVLVGHSLGGLYLQLYARQHPEEVQALILVDSTHPEQLRGKGAQSQWPAWLRVGFDLLASDVVKQEFDRLDATGQRVLSLPPPAGVHVWVLSALRPMQERSELADDANEKRAALAALYPGAKQVWVDSGHVVPLEKPEAVTAAIREALSAGR